jgi:hypothetical protein
MIYLCQPKLSTYNIPIRITAISSTRVHCVILRIILLFLLQGILAFFFSKHYYIWILYNIFSVVRPHCTLIKHYHVSCRIPSVLRIIYNIFVMFYFSCRKNMEFTNLSVITSIMPIDSVAFWMFCCRWFWRFVCSTLSIISCLFFT